MNDKNSPNPVIQELAHESGRGLPKWLVAFMGLAVLILLGVGIYLFGQERAGDVDHSDKLQREIDLKSKLPGTPEGLCEVMLGSDLEMAKLAVVRLALEGDRGYPLLFESLPKAAPEVQGAVQNMNFYQDIYVKAANFVAGGSANGRQGGLIVILGKGPLYTDSWLSPYIFRALIQTNPQTDDEKTKTFEAMKRYHPTDLDDLFARLEAETDVVKASAVAALCGNDGADKVAEARQGGGPPDAKLLKGVLDTVEKAVSQAKEP